MAAVIVSYLEQRRPAEVFAPALPPGLDVREVVARDWRYSRFLYTLVGGPWQWTDRLTWDEAQWRGLVEQPGFRTWVGYMQGAPAGFFELRRSGDEAELVCFGLADPWIGRGLGGGFLHCALHEAWASGAARVWLQTNTQDHPHALDNYLRRGFTVFRTEVGG